MHAAQIKNWIPSIALPSSSLSDGAATASALNDRITIFIKQGSLGFGMFRPLTSRIIQSGITADVAEYAIS
jgi:hypothetical protein